jgi:hypothetical protein
MRELQSGLARLRQAGKDARPIGEIMWEYPARMKAGEHEKAQTLLDRAIQELEQIEKN